MNKNIYIKKKNKIKKKTSIQQHAKFQIDKNQKRKLSSGTSLATKKLEV